MDAPAAPAIDWRFETPRLRARLVDDRDRDLYRNLYADPAVMAHIGAVLNQAEADIVFGKVLRYNVETPVRARYWRLSDIASGDDAGLLSNLRMVEDPGLVELGIMLLPCRQGRRIGLELATKIIDLLMENRWGLDTRTVIARTAPTNARVACLTTQLGFEAIASQNVQQEWWRLTREEWLAANGG